MATIVTRASKGEALSHTEMDSNFSNLNTELADKVEETSAQALHGTDALRIAGSTISLYKGDGSSESVTVPISYSDADANEFDIGVGQTWQYVGGSRIANVSYQNTTGKPIMVSLNGADNQILYVSDDGSTWIDLLVATGDSGPISFIVPNNWYYKSTYVPSKWNELR